MSNVLKGLFLLVTLGFATTASAVDDPPPPGCGSWGQVSTQFLESCLLNGGDSMYCDSSGTPMCCKHTSEGTHCAQDPGDLAIRRPGKIIAAPGATAKLPTRSPRRPTAPVNPPKAPATTPVPTSPKPITPKQNAKP
jgi:hypothetical protein